MKINTIIINKDTNLGFKINHHGLYHIWKKGIKFTENNQKIIKFNPKKGNISYDDDY